MDTLDQAKKHFSDALERFDAAEGNGTERYNLILEKCAERDLNLATVAAAIAQAEALTRIANYLGGVIEGAASISIFDVFASEHTE